MVTDPSPAVRLQLALTLGTLDNLGSQNALVSLLLTDRNDYWIRTASLSSLRNPAAVLPTLLAEVSTNATPGTTDLIRDLADVAIGRVDHPAGQVVEIVTALEKSSTEVILAGLEGLDRGLARKSITPSRLAIQPLLSRLASRNNDLFVATWKISKRLGMPETAEQKSALAAALRSAQNSTSSRADRLRAIERLRFGTYKDVRDALFANLAEGTDAELQSAALAVLRNFRDDDIAEQLVQRWPTLAPSIRISILNLLLGRRSFHNALVTAIEKGDLKLGELNLDLEQRRILLRESSPDIQSRAAKFIGDEEYSNRKTVLDEWLAKLPASGDAIRRPHCL